MESFVIKMIEIAGDDFKGILISDRFTDTSEILEIQKIFRMEIRKLMCIPEKIAKEFFCSVSPENFCVQFHYPIKLNSSLRCIWEFCRNSGEEFDDFYTLKEFVDVSNAEIDDLKRVLKDLYPEFGVFVSPHRIEVARQYYNPVKFQLDPIDECVKKYLEKKRTVV